MAADLFPLLFALVALVALDLGTVLSKREAARARTSPRSRTGRR